VLPFPGDAYLALLARYNQALWPAPLLAAVLAAACIALVLRPMPAGGRIVAAALAAMWLWNAVAFHLAQLAALHFLAPLLAAAFALEALLLAWTGAVRGRLAFAMRRNAAGRTGLALAVFALLGYPLLATLAGHGWPALAVIGIAPSPTTLLTLGLLLCAPRLPLHLLAIPALWALATGAAAWSLHLPEDLTLPAAAVVALAAAAWARRTPP